MAFGGSVASSSRFESSRSVCLDVPDVDCGVAMLGLFGKMPGVRFCPTGTRLPTLSLPAYEIRVSM